MGHAQADDFWLFVGNSGGYLAYCFDHARFKPIPLSMARKYHRYEYLDADHGGFGIPSWPYGSSGDKNTLWQYWSRYLAPKFEQRNIKRIMLVDHSTSGQSVEATKQIFQDIFYEAGVASRFRNAIWGLYNVVDTSILPAKPPTNPDGFDLPSVRHASAGAAQAVNHLVGDKRHHNRIQVEYYPRRWYKTTTEAWSKDGGLDEAKRSI
ncbi:hypothetical protein K458DRAFT_395543 [Lentithecium fluviatile CBS 122367]|uniref:Uncharacterized protein n=1 Tax=Lentithecium fluviatile CBS 122367 TaxID=1168545 RepID=A0A6G1IIT7_9PLEO|nr:hypothetical protein K458DRAFT_395543 [Lentithecium fluviatile CBS 122367]